MTEDIFKVPDEIRTEPVSDYVNFRAVHPESGQTAGYQSVPCYADLRRRSIPQRKADSVSELYSCWSEWEITCLPSAKKEGGLPFEVFRRLFELVENSKAIPKGTKAEETPEGNVLVVPASKSYIHTYTALCLQRWTQARPREMYILYNIMKSFPHVPFSNALLCAFCDYVGHSNDGHSIVSVSTTYGKGGAKNPWKGHFLNKALSTEEWTRPRIRNVKQWVTAWIDQHIKDQILLKSRELWLHDKIVSTTLAEKISSEEMSQALIEIQGDTGTNATGAVKK